MAQNFQNINLLTQPQKEELTFAFNTFMNSQKVIEPQQYKNILLTLDLPLTQPPKDSQTLTQFLSFAQILICERDNVDDQVKAFKILDDTQEGFLNVRKLTQAASACGVDITVPEAQEMLSLVAPSVGEGEYLRILNRIQ